MYELANLLFPIIVSFNVILLLPVGIISGVIFLFLIKGEQDEQKKRRLKKRMWWSFAFPFCFLLLISVVYFGMSVFHTMSSGVQEGWSGIVLDDEKAVAEYKAGKVASLMFLVGQGMRKSKGSANPGVLKTLFEEALK